jgi:hypothetical protein
MSINQTKLQLAEAIDLYNHLKVELDDKSNLETYSEEEWQARIRNLGLEAVNINLSLNISFLTCIIGEAHSPW